MLHTRGYHFIPSVISEVRLFLMVVIGTNTVLILRSMVSQREF